VGSDPGEVIKYLKKHQLVELDACVHCAECVKWCPVTTIEQDLKNTPMDKIAVLKSIVQRTKGPLKHIRGGVSEEELKVFADQIWRCTTCGRCGVVCPVGINCQELWPAVRAGLIEMGYGPVKSVGEFRAILEEKHNPFDKPAYERNAWAGDFAPKETAELAFFVGCELAFRATPMASGALKLLMESKADFTISEDEWCCGFPLYVLGERRDEFKAEVAHNVEALKKKGVKRVAASCPCCYAVMKNVWPEHVEEIPFEVTHILTEISDLVDSSALKFTKAFAGKVAYHDPCYLSRGWGEGEGIIDEPRNILASIAGVELVELPENKRLSRCPGSGGGLRRSNPELSEKMAADFVEWVGQTGADVLLTSCPAVNERVNHILSKEPEHEIETEELWGSEMEKDATKKFKVMDILEFVSMHL